MKLPLPTDIVIPAPKAYLVGGAVRDMICGRHPMDLDIAVANDPKAYAKRLAAKCNGHLVVIGNHEFPLYRVVNGPLVIDVTLLKGGKIARDLMDRDFTINALACSLADGNLIDAGSGLTDLKQGLVRMVSSHAFEHDPVRLVRAFRMVACFDFKIETATAAAISTHAALLQHSAGERIWAELALILACTQSVNTLQQMAQCGLLHVMLPELMALEGCCQNQDHNLDVYGHTLLALDALESIWAGSNKHFSERATAIAKTLSRKKRVLLKLALLLHDIGKPSQRTTDASGNVHFYGHAAIGARMAKPIFERLRLPKRHAQWVRQIIDQHQRPLDLYLAQQHGGPSKKALGKFLRQSGAAAPCLILHAIVDNMGKKPGYRHHYTARMVFFEQLLDAYYKTATQHQAPPLIDGKDLMATFDLYPSPLLGSLLRGIQEARLAGTIIHRRQALDWVEAYLNQKSRSEK